MSPDALDALVRLHDAAAGAEVLRPGPRRRVTRHGDVVVKGWAHDLLGRAAALLGASPAARVRAAALELRARGLPAPEPLGVAARAGRSWLAWRRVDGPTLQEALACADRAGARALAVAAAALAARLHAAGVAARDLKPANLVVTGDGLVLVDLDDVTIGAASARVEALALRNLAALDAYAQLGPRPLGVGARLGALRAYAAARGEDPRPWLARVLPRSREKRRRLLARLRG